MLRALYRTALAALLALLAGAAQAHNYHVGLTEIGFNRATGNTEVVHTYAAHDVEALLMNLYQRQVDLGLEEDQALFRRYLEQRFRLSAGGKPLPLQWVGLQANADSVVVFQELPGSALPPGAMLLHAVLTDFIATQVNTVTLERPGQAPLSLNFDRQQREQALP